MLRRLLLCLGLCLTLPSLVKGEGILASRCSDAVLDGIVAPLQFSPLPLASSPSWRATLPEAMCESYIALGERHLGQPWPTLPVSLFADYKTTGNRVRYESACFAKRTMLAELVMAELAEGKGRFLDMIVDGLWSHLEETWWGIPAHYATPYPTPADQTVDLFNAETASLIAWTTFVLSDSLDARSPIIRQRAREEISRRILQPALSTDYWWKRAGMNWNPWICSNWLTCVLFCESDRTRQLAAIRDILQSLDTFISSYPDDGGCDEGPGYWERAAASLFDALHLLSLASGGSIDISNYSKLQAMGSYAYKTYIQNGYCTNFADSHDNKSLFHVNVLYPFGIYLHDDTMKAFAKYLWQGDASAAAAYSKSGNFPTLGRELLFLSHYDEFGQQRAQEPLLPDVWFPNLQVMATRGHGGLYLAMKGGHNDESHNHNDVGSFIVYADGEPLLIDPGVGEYTAKTFGASRYDIWTMQSCYHNLPRINGCDQSAGKSFAASGVTYKKGILSMDISGAYPAEAQVKKWQRTVGIHRSRGVTVAESYELSAYSAPSSIHLMTTTLPVIGDGVVSLGSHRITFPSSAVSADYEDISPLLDPLLKGIWGEKMYRITLTIKSQALKGTIRYEIK